MAIFPFENAVTNDDDFARRQEQYTALLASDEKPFDFMVILARVYTSDPVIEPLYIDWRNG